MPEVSVVLTLAWVAVILLAVVMYVLLDGFDLGVGILFPYLPSHRDRDLAIAAAGTRVHRRLLRDDPHVGVGGREGRREHERDDEEKAADAHMNQSRKSCTCGSPGL